LTPPSSDARGFGFLPGGGWRTSVSWNALHRDYTGASINYDVSFDGSWKASELNGFNHFLSASYQAKVKPRLLFSVVGIAESSNVTEYLFRTPSSLSLLENTTNIDELANGTSRNAFSGSEVLLTGPSASDSPLLAFLSNSRIYSVSGGLTLTYWKSRRLSY